MKWHLITDEQIPFHIQVRTLKQCAKEVELLHVRNQHASLQRLRQQIEHLLRLGFTKQQLILNYHTEAAIAWGLGGIHLKETQVDQLHDLKKAHPTMTIGASVHDLNAAQYCSEHGADYVYVGHVFDTPSKHGTPGRGLDFLQNITSNVSVPIYAVGGVTTHSATQCLEAGAHGVAVMSAIWQSDSPKTTARQFTKGDQ
ncbi:thiamine phosphate synthase [Geomicrobium sediminis]|uniref:Thiazole tautomerase (Transcriptional regulator TenI) n=1 Tax=Geomicrobium sediminis TaxID=1347788 RepID=A0ABS2PCS7_9BACL|nr:thiamine phosphate synthase [Geomicrobium sediminis]MBM7633218.1 thiazole tautomerase (transcriptional regulator TenI) [Geomicrobium sediminis]